MQRRVRSLAAVRANVLRSGGRELLQLVDGIVATKRSTALLRIF